MNTSLSNPVDNLPEINKQECKKCKERKHELVSCKHIGYANNKLIYKCDKCNKRSYKPITSLIQRFFSTYQFCNGDNNKLVLQRRKGIYPYDYTDDWERFKETQLPLIEDFYNALNKEHITKEAHKVWNTFNIKNLGEYHDLYVPSQGRTQNEYVSSASLNIKKMSATMVGRQGKFFILDGLRQS